MSVFSFFQDCFTVFLSTLLFKWFCRESVVKFRYLRRTICVSMPLSHGHLHSFPRSLALRLFPALLPPRLRAQAFGSGWVSRDWGHFCGSVRTMVLFCLEAHWGAASWRWPVYLWGQERAHQGAVSHSVCSLRSVCSATTILIVTKVVPLS